MSSILERAIVHLLNEEEDKAKALFHKFMVEKARAIHESLRTGEEIDLAEGWDDELTSAEYFTPGDMDGVEDEHADDAEPTDTDDASDTLSGDLGTDADADGDEHDDALSDTDAGDDTDADGADGDGDEVHDAIQKLVDEFEEMMTKLDGIEAAVGDAPADDDEPKSDDEDGTVPADDEDHEEPTGDEPADEDEPVDEGDEYEDLEDITESVMAELEKITVNLVDGKEVGDGKSIPQNSKSSLPSNSVNQRMGGKPIEQKFDANDSFERQPSPSVRDGMPARNAAKKADSFQSSVAKGGDSSASLNKDFAGGPKPSKSTIDGK